MKPPETLSQYKQFWKFLKAQFAEDDPSKLLDILHIMFPDSTAIYKIQKAYRLGFLIGKSEEDRLTEVCRKTIVAVSEHLKDGGTYRVLLKRLPVHMHYRDCYPHGMAISNAICDLHRYLEREKENEKKRDKKRAPNSKTVKGAKKSKVRAQ